MLYVRHLPLLQPTLRRKPPSVSEVLGNVDWKTLRFGSLKQQNARSANTLLSEIKTLMQFLEISVVPAPFRYFLKRTSECIITYFPSDCNPKDDRIRFLY